MKTKHVLLSSVVLASMLGASALYAKPGMGKGQGPGFKPPRAEVVQMLKHLKPEQKQQLQKISKQFKQSTMPLRKKLKVERVRLNGKIVSPNTTFKTVKPELNNIARLKGTLLKRAVKAQIAAYKVTGELLPPRVIAHFK
jgi:Spy/CpxP family protein refolding chaperone